MCCNYVRQLSGGPLAIQQTRVRRSTRGLGVTRIQPAVLRRGGALRTASASPPGGTRSRQAFHIRSSTPSDIDTAADGEDWVAANEDTLRRLPLFAGGAGGLTLLVNRTIAGVAPVSDASSSQSRADVIALLMCACLLLTGLSWLQLRTRPPERVDLLGAQDFYLHPDLPRHVADELQWVWDSLDATTLIGSLVVVHGGRRVLQAGTRPTQLQLGPEAPPLGPIVQRCLTSGKGNYLANTILFPGRKEFETCLPTNVQGVLVQPIGSDGVIIAGTGTVRGFGKVDQAWIATLADKLEVSLEDFP